MPFGLQMALAYPLDAISQGPKKFENSRAQPPPTSPSNGYSRIQNIMHTSPLVTLMGCILGRSRAHTVVGGGGGAGE